MARYDPRSIEKYWQAKWAKDDLYKADNDSKLPKFYCLDMFPYPSGEGLHVGHFKGYTATDIISRHFRMKGYNILHPMGWDAFGLPAENYAIKTGIHPKITTQENIKRIKSQMQMAGLSYDWSREINTSDPNYYKWTQWIFLKLYEKGLAYEAVVPINFCPKDKTGLANEEVVAGKCERCGTKVVKKDIRQWILKITKYAERLLSDLDGLDWPESIIEMQKNWIGKSEGATVKFTVHSLQSTEKNKAVNRQQSTVNQIDVFTTRPDTLFGATYMVLAPEHPLVAKLTTKENKIAVEKYIAEAKEKSDLERTELAKTKTGVFIGSFAINPVNSEKIPIWVADYVLISYGTGAIMAVPAHDERDFEFAKKYKLPIQQVIAPKFIDPINVPRKEKKTIKRNTVHAIIRRPSDNKFLLLQWKGNVWGRVPPRTFIIGGIEDDEDPIEAAKREIHEETGYNRLRFVGRLNLEVHTEYFAAHKDENRYSKINVLYFELTSNDKDRISTKETKKHDPVWIEEDKVSSFINVVDGPFIWDRFKNAENAYVGEGVLINSGKYTGLDSSEAVAKITSDLTKQNFGKKTVNYKLRDWIFSRQRYWGEPIPIIHCPNCGTVPLRQTDLPLLLPEVENYQPSGTGESPLAKIESWVNTTCWQCKGPAKRETNTMPQWAGSCWYYLRFTDPKNNKAIFDTKKEKYWLGPRSLSKVDTTPLRQGYGGVDWYVGGAEHAVLHLLYARFWHKFLFEIGVVSNKEPFAKLRNVGLIRGPDGQKMSKSRGNIVTPDDIINSYGADTLRLYECFLGPFNQSVAWDTSSIEGIYRFLNRVWQLITSSDKDDKKDYSNMQNALAKLNKKVEDDILAMRFNTAIAAMMEFVNLSFKQQKPITLKEAKYFLKILAPFAPHITEELWRYLGGNSSIHLSAWPKYDSSHSDDNEVTIVVQVDGKVRDTFKTEKDVNKDELAKVVLKLEKVEKWTKGKKIRNLVFVPNKLINIVTE